MGQVTVTIAEKIYRIACDDGQEDHLMRLAGELDEKITEMRRLFGEIGDNRLTVMAVITVLDERYEIQKRVHHLEEEVERLRLMRSETAASLDTVQIEITDAITQAAERIETLTRQLIP